MAALVARTAATPGVRIGIIALAALAVTAVACDGSKKELEKTVAQMQQISAEKDSLLKDVMSTSQFIANVNSELAKVKSRSAGKPVAVLEPYVPPQPPARQIGLLKGRIRMSDDFDDPLPDFEEYL